MTMSITRTTSSASVIAQHSGPQGPKGDAGDVEFNVTASPYNAPRNGQNATTAITEALVACNAVGGGRVYLPRGTYTLNVGAVANVLLSLANLSNIEIYGDGIGVTILYQADSQNSHVINMSGATNIRIRDLTIDGNYLNQTADVHGIRSGGVNGLTIERVEVKNCRRYCIGLQSTRQRRISFTDLYLHTCGADGIDFKNTDDTNEGIYLTNIFVENWGLLLTDQAGVDCRGLTHCKNITVLDVTGSNVGIRFRNGELLDPNGLGAHGSTLDGFEVDCDGSTTVGVSIDARDCKVSKGVVRGAHRGVRANEERSDVSDVTCYDSLDSGFCSTDPGTAGLRGDSCNWTRCRSITSGSRGFRIQADYNTLTDCYASGSTTSDILVNTGMLDTTIRGGQFTSATKLGDAGLRTRVYGCKDITSASATLTIASGTATIGNGAPRVDGRIRLAIDTEGAAASDDLDAISGGVAGDIVELRAANDARTIVAKHGTSNLRLGGSDFTLDNTLDRLILYFDGTNYHELARLDNGA